MRIKDYETNRSLTDVALYLTREEVEELAAYLQQLTKVPDLLRVHLSDIRGIGIERELTVAIDGHCKVA